MRVCNLCTHVVLGDEYRAEALHMWGARRVAASESALAQWQSVELVADSEADHVSAPCGLCASPCGYSTYAVATPAPAPAPETTKDTTMTNNTITGKVSATKHAGTSYYGNPAYWVTIDTEAGDTITLRTQDNSGLAYGITNPEYRDEAHAFTLTRAGRIRSVVKAA